MYRTLVERRIKSTCKIIRHRLDNIWDKYDILVDTVILAENEMRTKRKTGGPQSIQLVKKRKIGQV